MDKTTKICLTAITIAVIWFLSQPIGGNMTFEANLDHIPYFNLTNSTVSGHAEISGYMPIGTMLPVFLAEILSSKITVYLILAILVAYCIYTIFKWRK